MIEKILQLTVEDYPELYKLVENALIFCIHEDENINNVSVFKDHWKDIHRYVAKHSKNTRFLAFNTSELKHLMNLIISGRARTLDDIDAERCDNDDVWGKTKEFVDSVCTAAAAV